MKLIILAATSLALMAPSISSAHHNPHWNDRLSDKYAHRAERHERKAQKHLKKAKQHARRAKRNEIRAFTTSLHSSHYVPVLSVQRVYFNCSNHHRHRSHDSWVEPDRRDNDWVPALTGGVIGGVLGYQIGDAHHMQNVSTLVGGAVGAGVGLGIAARLDEGVRTSGREHEHHLHRRDHKGQLAKYLVTYRYNGRIYRVHMDHHPGTKVRVG